MSTVLSGTSGDDHLDAAATGASVLVGKAGNDQLMGGVGNDVMYGGGAPSTSWTGRVTFQGEQGSFRNTFGVYEVDADGNIVNVRVVLPNASDDAVATGHSVDVTIQNGNSVGMFILPDGYHYNGGLFDWVARDGIAHHFELRNGDGTTPGNGNVGDGPLTLVWVEHEHGWTEVLRGAEGTATYHSNADLNPDGAEHVHLSEGGNGVTTLAFEDLWNGGDMSFADLTVTFEQVAKPPSIAPNDDLMDGGAGDDEMWGGNGADDMRGGAGNDLLKGGSGNDVLAGGEDNDDVHGGSGDDLLLAAGGGSDRFDGGSGFDTLSFTGVADMVHADLGKGWVHSLDADSSVLAASTLKSIEGFTGGDEADRVTGSSHANVLAGGAGDDWLRGKQGADALTGGEGRDTFAWTKSDVADASVDRLTDFTVGEDRLDLADFLPGKGLKGTPWADHVRLAEGTAGTTVQAKVAGTWQDVVVLEGVHTTHLADLGL